MSGLKTAELLRKAYATLRRIPTGPIELIVDGGPENNNAEIEDLIEPLPLKKLIAEVDIAWVNRSACSPCVGTAGPTGATGTDNEASE